MSKEFQSVGQYTEGHINNYDVQINMAGRAEFRPLVPAQKKELYDLGIRCTELGADSKDIWRAVFAELGVKQIGDIATEHFQRARSVLQCRLDALLEEEDKRRLVGKVLRMATEKDAGAELNDFCDVTFGRTRLNKLKRAELQRVLEFIQGFQVAPLSIDPTMATPQRMPLRDFLLIHRAHAAGLFVFGFIVGKFWF
ncbi:hypothetical protein BGP82_29095 [Pseudomonas putida]|uniref:Uncharacterized protein n=1 Tax=Pseudomonas putida TaxID=303 RepID=A0A2S3WKQ9_PSEPU|nr:hypothetical protein [Pseudomonas putida]POF99424.1 hypothetical protein BGP82_29095 [Pseudomonas putida]